MQRILIAGLPDRLASWLAQRLPGATVEVAYTGEDVLAVMSGGAWSALVVDHALEGMSAERAIRTLRTRPVGLDLPVLLTMDPAQTSADEEEIARVVSELRIDRLLLAPLDRGELVRHLGSLGQLAPPRPAAPAPAPEPRPVAVPTPVAPSSPALSAALAGVWQRALPTIVARIDAIERTASAMAATGSINREMRETAEREAHRLAGALGTFGSHEGTRVARAIEESLAPHAPVGRDMGARIGQLVAALRAEVEARAAAAVAPPAPTEPRTAEPASPAPAPASPPAPAGAPVAPPPSGRPAPPAPTTGRHTLVVLTDDASLAVAISQEAAGRNVGVRAESLAAAAAALDGALPDAVLMDVGDEEGAGWALLPMLARRLPGVPLLVATDRDSLLDRVRVLQLGARVFLEKPFTAAEALDAVARLLPEPGTAAETRVLAVDDDPQILAAVRALLEPQRLTVHTLDSPLRFWNALRQVQPDLLILDVDMPFLDGIELCRVVRADHKWSGLPILFLTARTDAETILRVFAAGADDYVTKPVVGPELIARLRNQLSRQASRA